MVGPVIGGSGGGSGGGSENAVESDTTGITGASKITNMVSLSQASYDAISSPNASTLYVIV